MTLPSQSSIIDTWCNMYSLLWKHNAQAINELRNENGKLHSTIGPAVEWENGAKEWWLNGKRHRADGPAVIWINGHKEWWFKGKRYGYKEYLKRVQNIITEEHYYTLLLTYGNS